MERFERVEVFVASSTDPWRLETGLKMSYTFPRYVRVPFCMMRNDPGRIGIRLVTFLLVRFGTSIMIASAMRWTTSVHLDTRAKLTSLRDDGL